MISLALTIGQTVPVSSLVRKAARLGLRNVEDGIALAAQRGCHHYDPEAYRELPEIETADFSDEELTVFLMAGEHLYEPMAIRCAAQLARSPEIDPRRLSRLARLHRVERVLAHIARAGLEHDAGGRGFWETVLADLPGIPVRVEPDLPHWTRFVSMPGLQRDGVKPPQWLTPNRKKARR